MKRLALLGGGHAQVQVVKSLGAEPVPDTAVVLINRSRLTPYSGMLPGLIAGHYTHAQCHIDLAWLCAQANIEFIEQEAVALDPQNRRIHCADGHSEAYDVLSIDTGSTPPLAAVPGASQHALPVKPIEYFLPKAEALVNDCATGTDRGIAVVGGGAAGFEVLLALAHRMQRQSAGNATADFHWITDTHVVLPSFPRRVRDSAARLLARREIKVHCNARVSRVTPQGVELSNGGHVDAAYVVWVTGAQPGTLFANSGLRTDSRGFIEVDATLRSISHPSVFASGDVANVIEHPRPKAGVFAVRQGPPLTRNLRLALAGREPQAFVPQRHFLVILSAGERYAIAAKGNYAVEGHWVWIWKDWIDRRFMARFQPASAQ